MQENKKKKLLCLFLDKYKESSGKTPAWSEYKTDESEKQDGNGK